MSHLEDKDIPNLITIDGFIYSYKNRKVNYNFAYRCRTRKCGVIIKITKENLIKIINKISYPTIQYTKISSKDHICTLKNEIEKSYTMTVSDSLHLAEQIIKNNLDKTLKWHSSNFKKINILINRNQNKYFLQKYRDINFP